MLGELNYYHGVLAAWLAERHRANVLFVHDADRRRDPHGALRRLAAFLEVSVSLTQTHGLVVHERRFPALSAPRWFRFQASHVQLALASALGDDRVTRERARNPKTHDRAEQVARELSVGGNNQCSCLTAMGKNCLHVYCSGAY
jgi:hypothetical protein